MPGQIVAFEGLNAVGKSTLAQRVATLLDAPTITTPPSQAKQARDLIDSDPFSNAAKLYYLSWVAWANHYAASSNHDVIVCDRHLGSTIAYFSAANHPVDDLVSALGIKPPALTVLVHADEAVRQRRLRARPHLRAADSATFGENFRTDVLSRMREASPLIEVDNSEISVIDTAEVLHTKIVQALDGMRVAARALQKGQVTDD